MKIMNKLSTYIKILLLSVLFFPAMAGAVTKKEMEEARTIAARAYIRYANNGSGYLDELSPSPTTMEELEAQLKPKEKENIKAFKAIPVPSDYNGWDKEKLVEYWAVTAFKNENLLKEGLGGRIRARAQINKMNIGAPEPAASTTPAATTAPAAEEKKPENVAPVENPAEQMAELKAEENTLLAAEEAMDNEVPLENKATNYTWVYIMALSILVAIVLGLVIYASKVMKGNNNGNAQTGGSVNNKVHEEAVEHYESVVADKDVEIAMLNKKLETAQRRNSELKSEVESLKAKVEALTAEVSRHSRMEHERVAEPMTEKPKNTLRQIFLGRANAKGIFVRADRSLNVGNSVFVLETSDGYSGSFKVANSPAAWSLALSNPREYLETACTGHHLDDTLGASKIVTETSGTAVFEGGCWKVIRKAHIRYEI